jgi:hypothetical protein
MKRLVLILFVVQSFIVVTEIGCDENSELKYIRKMLKEYALCQCISKGHRIEEKSIYDGSGGRLMQHLSVDYFVFRKMDSVINNIYSNSILRDTVEGTELKYYYYRCLRFYEGTYLDSLVNTFDDFIKLDDYEPNRWKSQYLNDSIYIEELLIDSQREARNE